MRPSLSQTVFVAIFYLVVTFTKHINDNVDITQALYKVVRYYRSKNWADHNLFEQTE